MPLLPRWRRKVTGHISLTCNACNRYAYGAQFENKSSARIDWLPIRPLMTIYFAVSAGYRIYQFHDSRALMPALNSFYDPLQLEGTKQWLPIEAARKEEATLVVRQKEEEEYRRRVRVFANL